MKQDAISIEAGRRLMLAVQGLLSTPAQPASKTDVLEVIRRMGVLQIDTISVVARSPYLALFSRLGGYPPAWLDELLAEGALFEYWSHAACFIPIEDYGIYRRAMLDGDYGRWLAPWLAKRNIQTEAVMERIRQEGPLRSTDFKGDGRANSGWWNWTDEKLALEHLFNTGELMIARRENFQRVYDLRERVLPGWDDARALGREEVRRQLALQAVKCLGLARAEWVADYFRLKKTGIPALLEEAAAEGLLITTPVEGWKTPAYVHPHNAGLLEEARQNRLEATHVTLLSPFDPLVWDRGRARQLFGFDYTIEAYTPQDRRQYGYFCLPILWRGQLIGRVDAKAHRKDGVFEVRSLHFEEWTQVEDGMREDVDAAIQRCATWHRCPEVRGPGK